MRRCGCLNWTGGPCSQPCSPHGCASHTPAPSNPQAPQALLLTNPSPGGGWSPAGVPGGAISGPVHPPTSLVALKTALWRTDGGCLPPGRFISSFFKPCSDFSMSASLVPPYPSLCMLPLPPPPICQPSQERGPLASKVIELLGGGETGQGFLRECFWLPALGEGLEEGCDWRRLWAVGFPDSPALSRLGHR